eukprot:TRINITY_DN2342_c0_g1_i1.p1 TRINITY_DN2342_c0_g1~~TRINITY_DN2342_c0_g1_i1.p1  ORF type:complete len:683 (+),score=168.66 TRINITY_DN2342_c0_g1_i1:197-2245(+)
MSNNRGRERAGRRGKDNRRGGNANSSSASRGGRGGQRYSSEEEISSDDEYSCYHAIDDLVVSNTHINGAAKKTTNNLNHLLNFKAYAPRANSSTSMYQPRLVKRTGRKQNVFDKDRFVQANYRFIVKERSGGYNKNVIDPDVGVDWDDIVQVHLSTDEPYLCPICLDVPTVPKMTKCGHIYCWSCMIRYLNDDGKKTWRRCPICFESVTATHLKSVEIESINEWTEGQMISFSLLQRARDSTIPIPRGHWSHAKSRHLAYYTNKDSIFSRLSLISDITPLFKKEQTAIETAIAICQSTQDESLPYLAEAQTQLTQKYEEWVRENPVTKTEPKSESTTTSPRYVTVAQPEKQKEEEREEEEEEEPTDIWSEVGEVYEFKRLMSSLHTDPKKPATSEESKPKVAPKVTSGPVSEPKTENKVESKTEVAPVKETAPKAETNAPPDNVLFFQEEHGTLIFLHPLNVKMLLEEFTSYDRFPEVITAVILELEEQAVTEEFRRRYKYLRHLPISCSVLFCEIDLSKIVSERTMRLFYQQLRKRADKRAKERREKLSDSSKSQSDSSIYEELHQIAVASGPSIPISIPDFSSAPLPVASSMSPPSSDSYAAIVGGLTSSSSTTPVSSSPSSSSSSSTPSFAEALRNSAKVPLGEEVLRSMAFVKTEKKKNKKGQQVFVLSNAGGRKYGR